MFSRLLSEGLINCIPSQPYLKTITLNDPTKVISYARPQRAYSGKESKLKNKFGLTYRFSVEGGKNRNTDFELGKRVIFGKAS
jgi:hypothetical protein